MGPSRSPGGAPPRCSYDTLKVSFAYPLASTYFRQLLGPTCDSFSFMSRRSRNPKYRFSFESDVIFAALFASDSDLVLDLLFFASLALGSSVEALRGLRVSFSAIFGTQTTSDKHMLRPMFFLGPLGGPFGTLVADLRTLLGAFWLLQPQIPVRAKKTRDP